MDCGIQKLALRIQPSLDLWRRLRDLGATREHSLGKHSQCVNAGRSAGQDDGAKPIVLPGRSTSDCQFIHGILFVHNCIGELG